MVPALGQPPLWDVGVGMETNTGMAVRGCRSRGHREPQPRDRSRHEAQLCLLRGPAPYTAAEEGKAVSLRDAITQAPRTVVFGPGGSWWDGVGTVHAGEGIAQSKTHPGLYVQQEGSRGISSF